MRLTALALLLIPAYAAPRANAPAAVAPVQITEWTVPWEKTRPRDPYVDASGKVWFVGERKRVRAVCKQANPRRGRLRKHHRAACRDQRFGKARVDVIGKRADGDNSRTTVSAQRWFGKQGCRPLTSGIRVPSKGKGEEHGRAGRVLSGHLADLAQCVGDSRSDNRHSVGHGQ